MPNNVLGAMNARPSTSRTVLRDDLFHEANVTLDASGIDGSYAYPKVLRAGTILGQIVATKAFVPVKVTTVATAATNVNAFVVSRSAPFNVGDTISIGAATGRTITAINYSTNTITVGGAAFSPTQFEVVRTTNGAESARAILLEEVELRDAENRVDQSKPARVAFSGFVISTAALGDRIGIALVSGNPLTTNFIFDDTIGL
ncbi:MAG: hypothetical protein K2X29_05520 [Candidatus Obscuribacterales bacterium]|nr:hypothetical protein [Candidatus Obscuribacterales bacterium]